jgi:hypothetical protein
MEEKNHARGLDNSGNREGFSNAILTLGVKSSEITNPPSL